MLDLILTNSSDISKVKAVLPPLEAVAGQKSEHALVYMESLFPVVRNYRWVAKLRRTNEDPWMTRKIRRLWKKKIRVYRKWGKCEKWHHVDRVLQQEIEEAKAFYVDKLLEDGGNGRSFYSATKKLASATAAAAWTVGNLFVGLEAGEICSKVLEFFGGIAGSGEGLVEDGDPCHGGLPEFTLERTVELLGHAKSTDSIVQGDPLPHLIRRYQRAFAVPVAAIYNKINATGSWPTQWKTEHLTIIPKKPNPTDFSECRNISCTSAFSKILENLVLLQLCRELVPDLNQYGGVPRTGVEHLLVDMWDNMLGSMEDGRTAAVLLGVDYEKAFNRMEHSVCVDQLEKLGASRGSISLVRAFVRDRKMTITINGVGASNPVDIKRGSPQGSVLGCLLYSVATQLLTCNLRGGHEPGEELHLEDGGDVGEIDSTKPGVFLYVDDTTLLDAVPVDKAALPLTTAATTAHFQNLALEGDFVELERRAAECNMKINANKTQLLVIRPRNGLVTTASVTSATGERIELVDQLKLVGFTFSQDPSPASHVDSIKDCFRRRIWMIYHLRRAGFAKRILYRLYCCYLRSIVEYCSAVYHPMLNRTQSNDLEAMRRLCFGFGIPMEEIMAEQCIGPWRPGGSGDATFSSARRPTIRD